MPFHKCFTHQERIIWQFLHLQMAAHARVYLIARKVSIIKQGRSTKCAQDGKGGPDASQMYRHIGEYIVYNIDTIYLSIHLSIYLSNRYVYYTHIYIYIIIYIYIYIYIYILYI